MKLIDLLNKIANGEKVPKKIMIYNRVDSIYEWKPIDNTSLYHYFNTSTNERLGSDWKLDGRILNTEVEIIEEKEIEKLEPLKKDWMTLGDIKFVFSNSEMIIVKKINELIDAVNELKKEK